MAHISFQKLNRTVLTRKQSGFSLIEVVVSAAIAATVVGALFAIAYLTIRLSVQGQDRLIASELSRDGLEVIRQMRDINYASGLCNPVPGGATARFCGQWYDGILTPANSTTPFTNPVMPIALRIQEDTSAGFKVQPVDLGAAPCSDYFIRNVDPASGTAGELTPALTEPTPSKNQEVFCRRIIIEPVDIPNSSDQAQGGTSKTLNAFRVRVQVAWKGYGRNTFRTIGALSTAAPYSNACPAVSTEWCTEETSILTNWRSTRI